MMEILKQNSILNEDVDSFDDLMNNLEDDEQSESHAFEGFNHFYSRVHQRLGEDIENTEVDTLWNRLTKKEQDDFVLVCNQLDNENELILAGMIELWTPWWLTKHYEQVVHSLASNDSGETKLNNFPVLVKDVQPMSKLTSVFGFTCLFEKYSCFVLFLESPLCVACQWTSIECVCILSLGPLVQWRNCVH